MLLLLLIVVLVVVVVVISPFEILVIFMNQEDTMCLKCIEENCEKHLNRNKVMQCFYISTFHN
jgi:hypothetical protein